jgi:hypothetical protein
MCCASLRETATKKSATALLLASPRTGVQENLMKKAVRETSETDLAG